MLTRRWQGTHPIKAFAGSPLTTGNRVRLLRDGPDTYRAMLVAIEGARDHVHMGNLHLWQ